MRSGFKNLLEHRQFTLLPIVRRLLPIMSQLLPIITRLLPIMLRLLPIPIKTLVTSEIFVHKSASLIYLYNI
ncbi:hypothetical protein [Chungangia koreensis]|uniref:hypothetical protein n=1 Tax=Chungangia koreensis TaxID=752657 RepID=UPI0036701EB4